MKNLLGNEELKKPRGKWNVSLRHTSNIESKLKELTVSTEICNKKCCFIEGHEKQFCTQVKESKRTQW